MGEHHSSSVRHHTTHVTHKARRASHRATHDRRSEHARRSRHAHHEATPSMSKKAIKRCHSMTYRQLLRHKDCASLLQRELNATTHSKHRSGKHKAAARRHKSSRHHETKHKVSSRHHRR
jgi:hypothetical protein